MYHSLYFILWILIGVVLTSCGISYDRLEFWIIFLSISALIMLRLRIFEKELEEEKNSGS
jgi:hypothetical protein